MIEFLKEPQGSSGKTVLKVDGKQCEVDYQIDAFGIWLNFGNRWIGYNAAGTVSDDGIIRFDFSQRNSDAYWVEQGFDRTGGAASAGSANDKSKKQSKVKSQMPGKVVRLFVKEGDVVEKGTALLVLEAMKMENEIRSPAAGKITQIKVAEGQAVESGVLLLLVE